MISFLRTFMKIFHHNRQPAVKKENKKPTSS